MNNDMEILRFMLRKKLNHDLTGLCSDNLGGIRTLLHQKRSDNMYNTLKEFAKSPLKALSPAELEKKLRVEAGSIIQVIYSDIKNMIEDPTYRPCEDCKCFVQYLDKEDTFSLIGKNYCSRHPELPKNAEINEFDIIAECEKNNWVDYYERSQKDLIEIRDKLEDAIRNLEVSE